MNNKKKDDLSKHKNAIKKYLEEEIVARYYFQKGRIEYSLKNDNDLKTATVLMTDSKKMTGILTNVEPATRPFNVKKKF